MSEKGSKPFTLRRTTRPWLRRFRARLQRLFPGHIPVATKLSLTIGILMVCIIGLMATLIVRYQQDVLTDQIEQLGLSLAAQMAQSATEPLLAEDQLGMEVLTTNVASNSNILGTAILNREGEVIAHAGIVPQQSGIFGPMPQLGRPWHYRDEQRGVDLQLISYSSPIYVQDVIAGSVLVTLNHSTWHLALQRANQAIIGTSLAVLLLGGLLTVWLSRRLSRPIYDLMNFSAALDDGSYDLRLKERRGDEFGHLMAAFNRFAEGMQQKHQAESSLERYLSPQLAKAVLTGQHAKLGGEQVEASVVFADIVGFTGMAEGMLPEEVANLLNQYFSLIARTAEAYGGMIDKYIGDCAMIVFGAPVKDEEHAYNAACCTLALRDLIDQFNRSREAQGHTPVRFRFGLNAGTMHAGNMGAELRMEYTVVGEAVNLASRLAGASEEGQILVTERFYQPLKDRIVAHAHRAMRLRGVSDAIKTYQLDGLQPEYQDHHKHRVQQLWWQSRKDIA